MQDLVKFPNEGWNPGPLEAQSLNFLTTGESPWAFHTNGIIQHVAFCIWLLSLSRMPLRFICVHHMLLVVHSFLWLNIISFIPHFIYPYQLRDICVFSHFLAIMNSTTMNICVQVLVWTCFQLSWVWEEKSISYSVVSDSLWPRGL